MTMVKWRSPALSRVERRMQQLFEEPFRLPLITKDMGWTPSVEVTETDSSIVVTAELPGVSKGRCGRGSGRKPVDESSVRTEFGMECFGARIGL